MRNRNAPDSRFWLISGLVHGALFLVLFLSPAGQRIFRQEDRPAKPEIVRQDDELADVVDDIRALAVARFRAKVAAIEDVSGRMEGNLENTIPAYRSFRRGQMASVAERLQGDETIELQNTLLEAIRAARDQPDAKSLKETFEATRAGIVRGQEEIRRALLLTAPDETEWVELQNQIEEKQFDVFELVTTAVRARSEQLQAIRQLKESRAEQESLQAAVEPTARGLKELEGKGEPLKEREDELEQIRLKTRQRVGHAKNRLKKDQEAGKDLEEARKALEEAEKAYNEARAKEAVAEAEWSAYAKQVQALRKAGEEQEKRLPILAKDIPAFEKRIPANKENFEKSLERARVLQEEVIAGQRKLHAQILSAVGRKPPEAAQQRGLE